MTLPNPYAFKPSTRWRDRVRIFPMIHVPNYGCDAKVHEFMEAEFLNFKPGNHHLTARQLFAAIRKKFGDARCIDILFYEH